jgi:predicted Zn-dependent protease
VLCFQNLLGRVLSLQNRSEEALPYLKEAVKAEPANFEAHAFLAEAYEQLGDVQDATAERNRAESLKQKPRQ